MGSVKDLKIFSPAYENRSGEGYFIFSDRYSIFDYGEMPDHIKNKGRALAVMSAFNFEGINMRGIPSHYQGLIRGNAAIRFHDLESGSDGTDTMAVSLAKVYKPIVRKFLGDDGQPKLEYDYSFFEKNRGKINNYLIPLEMIFRNGLPRGSSVFARIEDAKKISDANEREKKLKDIYQKLGLSAEPKPGDMLPKPVINYTTKLESGDRALTEQEAFDVSGLTEKVFSKLKPLILGANDFITERAEISRLDPHWDGKLEMRFIDGRLEIADVLGTLDEDRLGPDVSKELVRQWYKKTQPEFVEACKEWKKTGDGWQERMPTKPINLPASLVTLVSQMYMSAANQYVGKRIFNTPELAEVLEKIQPYK
jgi:phosphoribosylaminoimidazole-succinocarboxamide synthase